MNLATIKHNHATLSKLVSLVVVIVFLHACSTFQKSASVTKSGAKTAATPSKIAKIKKPLNLQVCPKMHVSNAPSLAGQQRSATACFHGVELYVAPAPAACLSSGYGRRGKKHKLHAGIDFQSKPAGLVIAAGNGTIVEMGVREDFGKWVVIDHGSGAYSSYAHLKKFAANLKKGVRVKRGQRLGIMGNTGNFSGGAIHLHYELREGNFRKKKNWWLLKSVNPFALPDHCF